MKTKRKILSLVLVTVLAVFCALAVSCGEPETPPVVKTEWPEAGVYYFDTQGDEYTLTLNVGDSFSLYVNGMYQSGNYTLKDSELVLDFFAEGKDNVTAEYNGNNVALTYDGASMRFLKKVNYTVAFDVKEGSATASQTVVNGKGATKPQDPTRDGYVFVGWYADAAYTAPYFFGAPVSADTVVYARWSQATASGVEFNVALDANYEGAEALEGVKTFGGQLFDLPVLTREGYDFGGWWFGTEGGAKLSHKYEDGMVLTGGDTLYALWIQDAVGTQLKAPVVNVNSGSVSWGAVDGARSYLVQIVGPDGTVLIDESTPSTTVNVPFASYAQGQYEIRVVAQANSGDSNNSESVRYYVNKALDKVSVFNVVDSMLVFGGVENAERYYVTVKCGNPDHDHKSFDNGSSKTFSFANCTMTESGISFVVTAVADGYASSVSDTFTVVRNLDKVGGLRFDDATETLYWNEVVGAEGYMVSVKCGNAEHDHGFVNIGASGFITLKECAPTEGGIIVKVYPKAQGFNSPSATEYVYNKTALGTPSDLLIAGTTLTWGTVEGATGYEVKIGNKTYTTETASFDLAALVNGVDGTEYVISVRALGDTPSLYSDELVANYYEMSMKLTYKAGVVTWVPVIGAQYYEVQVNNDEIVRVENGAFSAVVTLNRAGNNVVKVRFVDGRAVSDWATIDVFAHRVTFDTLGGNGIDVQYKAVGDPITLPNAVKAGYSFVAWYNVPGGAASNGQAYTNEFFGGASEIVLYAYYKANKYEITYNYGVGGNGTLTSDEVYFEQNYQLTVPTATDVAGAFGGWFSAPYGMGVQYTDANGKSLRAWDLTEGAELYAFWIDQTLDFTLTKINGKEVYAVSKGSRIDLVTEITVPATYRGIPVAFVAGNAFENCSNLKVINLPATIEQISIIAPFAGCASLEACNVYPVDGVNDPKFSSVDGILLGNGTSSKSLVLVPMAKLGTLRIPASVTEIPDTAFAGCSVSKVVVPAGVTFIGREAFRDCAKLTTVVFETAADAPALTIGARAFMNCISLERITLPARLANIKLQRYSVLDGVVSTTNTEDAFSGCLNLKSINVATGNANYKSQNGILYSADGRTLILAPYTLAGEFVIPEGVRTVSPGAFIGCSFVNEVTFPGTLTIIGEFAFYDMTALQTIKFAGNAYSDLAVDKYAFAECEKLATVEINETSRLATLGEGAFMNCTSIESFTVPATMSLVGKRAFEGCSALETVTFAPNGKTLEFGSDAFKNCSELKTVNLPANVSKIPGVFSGCSSLTEVNVDPTSTYFTSVDGVVFDTQKTEIVFFPQGKSGEYTLPDTIVTISNGVFQNVTELSKISIPASVTYIGDNAFAGASIDTIEFYGESQNALVIGDYAFAEASFGTLTLPKNTVSIGNNAFYLAEGDGIVISEGVTSLGDYAFYGATVDLTVPASVKTIGEYCFGGVLEEDWWSGNTFYGPTVTLTVEGSVLETIGAHAFEGNLNVTEITIPASVKTIGFKAFYVCEELETLTFAEGSVLETIEAYAFAGESSWYAIPITEVVLPAKLASLGAFAFAYTDLETVEFENGDGSVDLVIGTSFVETVLDYTGTLTDRVYTGNSFYYCESLESVVLPARLVELRVQTFKYAGDSYGLDISFVGENVRLATIGDECFVGSTLTSFTVPVSVRNLAPALDPVTGLVYDRMGIGYRAFAGLYDSLETLTFELGGTEPLTIGANAFENAALLTTVTLPARLAAYTTSNGEVVAPLANASGVFDSCDLLAEILVEDMAGAYYASLEGVLMTADMKELVMYPMGRENTTFTVPASVTKIHDRAFCESDITELTFVGGTENMTIGDEAFARCANIVSITLPENVVSIGDEAFFRCTSLETLTLSKKLQSFDGSMVFDCTALSAINVGEDGMGDHLSSIGGVLYNADRTTLILYPRAKTDAELVLDANVKVIAACAFANNGYITSIVLPECLVEINEFAFEYCSSLEKINIPSNVQLIGKNAFRYCRELTELTFAPEGNDPLIISSYAFYEASGLETIAFPARLYSIGERALYNCVSLTTVTFAENSCLVSIGSYAFNKSAILEINVPAGVIRIDDFAFFECSELESITLGEGLISIGSYAFAGCSELTSVSFPASLKTLGTSVFYYYEYDPYACPKLEDVTFAPNSQLECIPSGTFAYTALKTFTVPASVTLIEGTENPDEDDNPSVFYGLSTLESIYFENGSKCVEIGDYVFDGCENLKVVELPNSVSRLGNYLFNYCRGLESITIPETTTNLGRGMFWGCESLVNVELKSKTTTIPDSFFYGCKMLETVEIPATVSTIGDGAFQGTAISSFEVSKRSEYFTVVDGILYTKDLSAIAVFPPKSDVTDLVIPKEVISIGRKLFAGNTTLKTVVFEGGRTSAIVIGEQAFDSCLSLYSVVLPELMASLGDEAFYGCSSLLKVTISSGTLEDAFGYDCFYGCDKLVEVCNLSEIELKAGDSKCGGIAENAMRVYSEGESAVSVDANGFATMESDGEICLIAYVGKETDVVIPAEVTVINPLAFYEMDITSVVIPDTVKVIGEAAFADCENLTSVKLPAGLTEIAAQTFYYSGIKSIEIPASVKSIGQEAFYYSNLASVNLPEGLEYVGRSAFYGTDLTTIEIPASVKTIEYRAFANCNIEGSVSVGAVETMGDDVFYGNGNLTILVTVADKPAGWSGKWNRADYSNYYATLWGFNGEEITYTFVTGEGATAVESIVSATPITLPAAPVREGYIFGGWYNNAECTGDALTNGYYNSALNTIYAKWMNQEEYEAMFSGTSFEYAINLNYGEKVTVNIDEGGEKVYYKVTATTDGHYHVFLDGGDTKVMVYSSTSGYADETLGASYESGYNTIDEDCYYSWNAGTTYYLVVLYYSSYDTGSLDLIVTAP